MPLTAVSSRSMKQRMTMYSAVDSPATTCLQAGGSKQQRCAVARPMWLMWLKSISQYCHCVTCTVAKYHHCNSLAIALWCLCPLLPHCCHQMLQVCRLVLYSIAVCCPSTAHLYNVYLNDAASSCSVLYRSSRLGVLPPNTDDRREMTACMGADITS